MEDKKSDKHSELSQSRREALKRLGWAAPVVIATAAVRARAAAPTTGGCDPDGCLPDA